MKMAWTKRIEAAPHFTGRHTTVGKGPQNISGADMHHCKDDEEGKTSMAA